MVQVQPERPVVPEIDVQEARRRAERGEGVIVDVREPEELAQASVPGAIHITLGQLGSRLNELPHDKQLLMFCRSGNRSSFATEYARNNGYPTAVNVAGGVLAWSEAGLSTEGTGLPS